MNSIRIVISILCLLSISGGILHSQEGWIEQFPLNDSTLSLHRLAQSRTPFGNSGRRFAILGFEGGPFEAWAYPLKLFRNFEFVFFLEASTTPIPGQNIVRSIEVTPARTTMKFTTQSFVVRAHFITSVDQPGSLILLDVDSTAPLTIVCRFLPVLQPMWPAGIGGQYAHWDGGLKAYVISESSRRNHGFVGSSAASGISYTPAHMLADTPHEFKIEIPEPDAVKQQFAPIAIAGGTGDREDVKKCYEELIADPGHHYRKAVDHYRQLFHNTLSVKTPSHDLNLAFDWAKVAYERLVVDHPSLGRGLVAGLAPSGISGRPGFGWFFGGDTYVNALSLMSYGAFHTVGSVLAFQTQFQRDDGKMAHEISQAVDYIDWFKDYPYAYIHGDTSPYFIVAMAEYLKWTGDIDLVRAHWPCILMAYEWAYKTDSNGDGLMDNTSAGLGALEYGNLTGSIATDIYLGAVWVKATQSMCFLAESIGKKKVARNADIHRRKAESAFRRKFWDESSRFHSYAFNEQGGRVKVFSPWNSVGLMWGLDEEERARCTLQRLCAADLTTDWGVRSISSQSSYYEPLNYNYGAVWPFLNSWVATALFKNHLTQQGYNVLLATARHTYHNQLGSINEVFSGAIHSWPEESVPHQGFSSAGVVLPLIRGLLGLEANALERTLTFAPHLPADWDQVELRRCRVGDAMISIRVSRQRNRFTVFVDAPSGDPYKLLLMPAFGPGTQIEHVNVNGKKTSFHLIQNSRIVQPRLIVELTKPYTEIGFFLIPTVEILAPDNMSLPGEGDKGLKLLSVEHMEKELVIECEGLGGKEYGLPVAHADLVRDIIGGVLVADTIRIEMPQNESSRYVRKKIRVITRQALSR